MGRIAYRLELPEEINQIHNTFHESQLRKFLVDYLVVVPLEDIQVDDCLNYIERPVAIHDRRTKTLTNKVLDLMKVQWQHRKGLE